MKKLLVILMVVSLCCLSSTGFAQLGREIGHICGPITRMPCDLAGQNGTDACLPFDFETGSGRCTTKPYTNRAIFSICNCPEVETNFKFPNKIGIRMTLMVNGKAQVDLTTPLGAYWADPTDTIINFGKYAGSQVTAAMCADTVFADSFGPGHYYESGADLLATGYATPRSDAACKVDDPNRATVYVTDRSAGYPITLEDEAAGVAQWAIDIPLIRIDPNILHSGETVQVKVEFLLQSGGGICTNCPPVCWDIIDLVKVCCTGSADCFFPYFTSVSPAVEQFDFWNGIAIVNRSATAGTAKLSLFQQDGAKADKSVDIDANSMYVTALENIEWEHVTGTLGGLPVQINVTSNFGDIDGFAFMADSNNVGESMGYLCRKSCPSPQ